MVNFTNLIADFLFASLVVLYVVDLVITVFLVGCTENISVHISII